ncbi:PREDICTED: uncharacterized protein LOC106806774 [Priapulus caudatus]|uniref:Uncharacterized protein LOC106806774 n=1 Tax=Priapulus caudatus TaxID=37621 RepID=A0ABM1DWK8_PRICU|nr:PREDICTED: uncharacterized protein LOC106806774 [Priapulus caudatus]
MCRFTVNTITDRKDDECRDTPLRPFTERSTLRGTISGTRLRCRTHGEQEHAVLQFPVTGLRTQEVDTGDDYSGGTVRFENTVVVLHDAALGIIEAPDRALRLVCEFEKLEHLAVDTGVRVPMISSMPIQPYKAPVSDVFLKIVKGTDLSGSPSTALIVGQDATLVVTLKDNSHWDITVTNCVAHDGVNSIMLIDEHGCPADSNLVSRINKLRDYPKHGLITLAAQFTAFKFPDRPHVYFQCSVLVCFHKCYDPPCYAAGASTTTAGSGRRSEHTSSGDGNVRGLYTHAAQAPSSFPRAAQVYGKLHQTADAPPGKATEPAIVYDRDPRQRAKNYRRLEEDWAMRKSEAQSQDQDGYGSVRQDTRIPDPVKEDPDVNSRRSQNTSSGMDNIYETIGRIHESNKLPTSGDISYDAQFLMEASSKGPEPRGDGTYAATIPMADNYDDLVPRDEIYETVGPKERTYTETGPEDEAYDYPNEETRVISGRNRYQSGRRNPEKKVQLTSYTLTLDDFPDSRRPRRPVTKHVAPPSERRYAAPYMDYLDYRQNFKRQSSGSRFNEKENVAGPNQDRNKLPRHGSRHEMPPGDNIYELPPGKRRYEAPPGERSSGALPHDRRYEAPSGERKYEMPPSERRYEVPPGDRKYEAPPGERKYEVPSGDRRYEAPPGERKYEVPPGDRRYEAPPGERKYEVPPGDRRYEAPPGERKYEMPPGERRSGGLPGERSYEAPPGGRKYEMLPGERRYEVPPGDRRYEVLPDNHRYARSSAGRYDPTSRDKAHRPHNTERFHTYIHDGKGIPIRFPDGWERKRHRSIQHDEHPARRRNPTLTFSNDDTDGEFGYPRERWPLIGRQRRDVVAALLLKSNTDVDFTKMRRGVIVSYPGETQQPNHDELLPGFLKTGCIPRWGFSVTVASVLTLLLLLLIFVLHLLRRLHYRATSDRTNIAHSYQVYDN